MRDSRCGKIDAKRALKPALLVIALGFAGWGLLKSTGQAASIPVPHAGWLAAAVVLFLVHYALQAAGWHLLLVGLGERVRPEVSVRMWYMSLIARWMPGRIWYSATRLYLAREAGISATAVAFAIVLELLFIMAGGIMATLLFAGPLFGALLTSRGASALWIVAGIVILAGAVCLRPRTILALCRFRLFRKAVRKLSGGDLSAEQLPPSLGLGRSMGLLAWNTLFWVYSGLAFGVLAAAFMPMNGERWLAAIPSFAGSWLVGFFSLVTPAGLGAREGALWLMLRPVMDSGSIIALAVASRLMMIATELLSVGIVGLIGRRRSVPAIDLEPKLAA